MRRTPMKRTGFLRRRKVEGPDIVREPRALAKATRRATYVGSDMGNPISKERVSQSAAYMAAVRDLGYCMRCRKACRPQFCHADQGKGMGIKTDVRRGWPGCAECHWIVGTSGVFPKAERRQLEDRLARETRAAILAAWKWPQRLDIWRDE